MLTYKEQVELFNKNDILLDYGIQKPTMVDEKYYKEHRYCPKCGSGSIGFTLASYWGKNIDKNKADCICGWHGIVDDLINKEIANGLGS